jgi:hypothetical protein
MHPAAALRLALDPSGILDAQGITPDPWQRDLLASSAPQTLLNCSRQSGKSTTVAVLALHTALFTPKSLTLLLSPTQRQSGELFRKVLNAYNALGRPIKTIGETQMKCEFDNGSRIVCLPGKEETIRSFSSVNLLIIDEAARVPDDLYKSVRPMLAVSHGRLIALSTPWGQRGWFFKAWTDSPGWERIKVDWKGCPRITADFILHERINVGDSWVAQEYECSFEALEGLVYPDFEEKCGSICTAPPGKPIGGIDFGFRNPFAAIWGTLYDDVIHIDGERYLRETALHEHSKALPRGTMWYADPAGRTEIEELRIAGHTVRKGNNDIRAGIAAVKARIETGRLKICTYKCPNIFAEAKLYRYPQHHEGMPVTETPVDEHNHALGALRYLISRVDSRFLAKLRRQGEASNIPAKRTTEPTAEDISESQEACFRTRPQPTESQRRWSDPAIWETFR